MKSCRACRLQQNEPEKVPLHHWEDPTEPWQRIHIDFAGPIYGYFIFILVDSFTKWVEVIPIKTTTSSWCVQKLQDIFSTFGLPKILISDNGRQFTSQDFESYLSDNGIINRTSAPYHPATNGQAERYVQTIKRALHAMEGERMCFIDKIRTIIMRLRRAPGPNGLSPYMLMFGREIRTKLHVMFRHSLSTPTSSRSKGYQIKGFAIGE